MKGKINAVLAYAFNNSYEVKVFRENGTVRVYTASYSESDKAYRLSQLFFILNQLVGFRLITERITWWEHLHDKG